MNDVTDIYNEAANKWSANKGVGSVILSEPLSNELRYYGAR